MLSDLTIAPLTRTLKWLVWLTVVLVLLITSVAIAYYKESQTNAARIEEWNRIQQDTLPRNLSQKAMSIANLLANPRKYDNQCVWVKGYLNIQFEGDAIYWRQEDYRSHRSRNALGIQFGDSLYKAKPIAAYSQHYVLLKGVFKNTDDFIHPGSILAIESINAY